MPPLISAEALFGAGILLLAIAVITVAGTAAWLLYRVVLWIMTGRV
jgi:hypothetical protein